MAAFSMDSSEASSAFARVLTVERDPRGPWLWALTAGLLLAGSLWVGLATDFLPCTLDCGETYEAHVAARNLWRFGWIHAGVQDFAANPSPAAHPTLYLHNPNLGMYALAGLYWLGIRSIHAQTPWLVLPFLLGMLYLYVALRDTCRSRLVAGCCLLQAASLYLLVVLWQFDALRVWSWLLTWGLVYHLVRWGDAAWPHASFAGLWLVLGLGVDYPFAVFLAALALACSALGMTRVGLGRMGLLVIGCVGGAFLLRQGQVALSVGPAVWWTDLTMTILRRLPLTTTVSPALDPAAFARSHSLVIWPGGGGSFLPVTWAWVIVRAYAAVLGWPLFFVGGLWLWAVAIRRSLDGPVRRALDLSLALAVAMAVTFVAFGEYVASFYGVYLMPLVVQWIIPVLGLTTAVLWTHRRVWWRRVPIGLLLLVALIGWRGGTEARNLWTLPPIGYPGRDGLAASPGASVATLWISSAPSAYTDQWAASLQTMRWLVQGPSGFTFEPTPDYYTFFERDRDNPVYRQPDFLLVPRLRTWGLLRRCTPLGGAILGFADGCSDLGQVETAMAKWPLARRGRDYLLYDLRALRDGRPVSFLDTPALPGLSSAHHSPPTQEGSDG